MDFDDDEAGFGPGLPPALVSLTPFASSVAPSPRRLSSCFTPASEPVRAKRQLAWVSLQGRLVGADEATSAKTVDRNGAFSAEEAVAWELFTPIQRVLTVAVASAAATNSNKNKQILKLQESVELRDQVLLSMQKKLDNLCEQVNYFKDQPETQGNVFTTEERGCKLISSEVEPDERRMSDLSDWAPSVTSSVDIQLDSLALEDDINSLRKECEQKDVTIKELSTFLKSSEVLGSKRIAQLEDIIRRKNMIINKLRKDIITLEQKVVNQTRLRRSSFPAASSNAQYFPKMADNVLYDVDITTDPSSSDSDSCPRNRTQAVALKEKENSVQISEKSSNGDLTFSQSKSSTFTEKNVSFRSAPLKECSNNQAPNSVPAFKPKNTTYTSGENRSRRRPPIKSKEVAPHKRWV